MKARTALLVFVLAAACGGVTSRRSLPPEGQVLLFVDTDAWLAADPGEGTATDTPALFEKLRIEFFPPGEDSPCAGCTRDFAPTRGLFARGQASTGFLPRVGVDGYRARVRLFHTGGAGETRSEPRVESTIETVVKLPVVGAEGIRELLVVLRTDDTGHPQGTLDAPVAPVEGRPGASQIGSWHAELRRDCEGEARSGEVCVPGGAFWMGDPTYDQPKPERLVGISPFFMDKTEVTVRAFRASGLAVHSNTAPDPVASGYAASCTYEGAEGPTDDKALNCVSLALAEKFCAARDAELPSEAQFDFVASARAGFAFPWGSDYAGCDDAVYARDNRPDASALTRECSGKGTAVAVPGAGARDRVRLPGGEIVDLAGNLSEWTRDRYSAAPGPCWGTVAVDPICAEGPTQAICGGTWNGPGGYGLASSARSGVDPKVPLNAVGFRCVRNR